MLYLDRIVCRYDPKDISVIQETLASFKTVFFLLKAETYFSKFCGNNPTEKLPGTSIYGHISYEAL